MYLIFAFIELFTPSPVAGTEDANDALPVGKSDGEDTTANHAKAEVALFSGAMRRVLRDNPLGVSKRELSHRESNAVFKLILAVLCRVPLESGFSHSSILRLRQTKSHTYIWLREEQPLTRCSQPNRYRKQSADHPLILRSATINGSRINAFVFKNGPYNNSSTHCIRPEFLLPLARVPDIRANTTASG